MKSSFKKILTAAALLIMTAATVSASGKRDKLFKLIEDGSSKEIKSALRENKDYSNITRGENKENLLMAALKEDREIDVISTLLKYGADPDKKDKIKRNSISYAAQYSSHEDVIEKVIKSGTVFNFSRRNRINKKDKNGKTSWDYARENQNSQMALTVLEKFGPEPAAREKQEESTEENTTGEKQETAEENSDLEPTISGTTPAFIENAAPVSPDAQPEEAPANVPASATEEKNEPEQTEQPAVEEQAPETAENDIQEDLPAVDQTLLNSTTSPEVKPYKKTYLFDYAEEENDNDPVEDQNYDPDHVFIEKADARDLNGRTKLMKAAKAGDLKLLENLIFSDANVNLADNDGWTALMFAARFCSNPKVVDSLIKNGADTFAKNNYGVSALKLAAGFNQETKITSLILSKYKSVDNEVRNAFVYGISSGASVSTLELFYKKGININSLYDGKTPLMYAAENNKNTKIIHWLLNNGAKTNYRSTEGKTAFDYAQLNKKLPHDNDYWTLNENGAN